MDEAYAKKQASNKDAPRQPRSPVRGAEASRDKSTSSNEKRDSTGKRNSFFTKRPKSSMTVGSNDSATRTQTPLQETREAVRPAVTSEAAVVPAESDNSRSRFLFGRGRKNRKSASTKLRASSPVDADDEGDFYTRLRKEEKHRRSSSGDHRMRISNPFGFQHAVKIERTREGMIESANEPGDMFADFRALRKGHRAAIIGPSREIGNDVLEEEVKLGKRPPPLRPKRSDEKLLEETTSSSLNGMLPLRQIRSAEAFSPSMPSPSFPQPVGMAASGHHGRRPAPLNHVSNIFAPDYLQKPSNTTSINDEWDRLLPLYDPRAANQMGPGEMGMRPLVQQELMAEPIRSPMFSPPLEQVPEEPEGTLSNRQSVEYPRQTSIRHAKSSPVLSRTNSKHSRRSNKDYPPVPFIPESPITGRPISQGSDTLGDPDRHSVRIKEIERPDPRKIFAESRAAASSWEDDIDFCYQHAAEADCDFNWNITQELNGVESDDLYRDDGPLPDLKKSAKREQSHSMTSTASSEGDQYKLSSRVYRVPSKEGVPELDYRSSHSASTNSISVLTPLDKSSFSPADSTRHASRELSKDAFSSPLLPLSELTMSQYYDDIVAKTFNPPPEAPKPDTPPPSIPARADSRPIGDHVKKLELPQLPTPPPSANQSPVISGEVDSNPPSHRDLSVDTIVAQLRSRGMDSPVSPEEPTSLEYPPPPPPKSPRTIARQTSNVTQLRQRSHTGTLNAAKLKLIDAQARLQELGPTSMPRNNSDDSVVTTIPIATPPTPPKSSYSKSGTPPPQIMDFEDDSPSLSTSIATAGSSYFNELTSTPLYSQREGRERPRVHRKVSSESSAAAAAAAAAAMTPPTSPPLPRREGSATGVRATRSSYSLFPQSTPQKLPKPLDLKGATSPMSPPPTGGAFPSTMRTPTGLFSPTGSFSPPGARLTAGSKSPRPKEWRLATA
jgi:hypothetical protein